MAEEAQEAKQVDESQDFDKNFDAAFDKLEKETPPESSTETKPEDGQTETPEPATAEVAKTDQVKEVDEDSSLSAEDKIAKITEILGDDQEAIDSYIKEKGFHTDPAWIAQRKQIDQLKSEKEERLIVSEEDKSALADFKEFRSTSEYVQMTMKHKGFTQEAIDKELVSKGFETAKPQNDVQLVLSKLNIDLEGKTATESESIKANIEDFSKVARVIFEDAIGKVLPKELSGIKEHIGAMDQDKNATTITNSMKKTTKDEGILDYEKDIEPALNKFMDDNPDADQQAIHEHFKSIYHPMTIARLKTGKKQEERDTKRSGNRPNVTVSGAYKGAPSQTGDFDKDADAMLDAMNVS